MGPIGSGVDGPVGPLANTPGSSSPTASDAAGSVDASVQSLPAVLPDIVKEMQIQWQINRQ